MKKQVLLIAASLIAGFANGQEAQHSLLFQAATPNPTPLQTQHLPLNGTHVSSNTVAPAQNVRSAAKESRTTSTMSRWYDYSGEYFIGLLQPYEASSRKDLNYYSQDLWNDTTGIWGYTGVGTGTLTGPYTDNGETTFNGTLSVAGGLDPTYSLWNEDAVFDGLMNVTSSDALTIDSVLIPGWYTRSSINTVAKNAVVDTLIIAFTSNLSPNSITTGAVLTDYSTSSINYLDLGHDITNNRAGSISGTTVSPVPTSQVYKFLLNSSDTNANANKAPLYPRRPADGTISYTIPAGQTVAMSVTYKSGDTSYHPRGGNPGDTIRYSNGTTITGTKYDYYQSQVWYVVPSTGSTTPAFNWYDAANRATSYFENAGPGWGAPSTTYYPNWNIITGTPTVPGAAAEQTPHLGFHLTCTTCLAIGTPSLGVNNVKALSNVNAYPNPATDELNITYPNPAKTTVTLTNMLGQVVASQSSATGSVTFNTAALPAGLYVYSLEANGERSTGRVAIAH